MIDQQRRALSQHLRRYLEGEVRFDTTSRRLYSTDASIYQIEPLGVVVPKSLHDLVTVIQVANETGVSITARGGGTSLSGQSIGPGIVVDCSKYLNNILELDPEQHTARIQPGVVLDQLNRAAQPHQLQFGPDVATASRANLCGMIGNNSAGARSIVYGKAIDHVQQLDVVLADGTPTSFGPVSPRDWQARGEGRSFEASLYRGVHEIVCQHRDEIAKRFPRILRRVSGYNLDVLCSKLTGVACGYTHVLPSEVNGHADADSEMVGLHELIVGSEGTLAFIHEARVRLVRRPKHRGLLVPQFGSLTSAMDALRVCLEFGPSAIEMLDHMMLSLAAQNLSMRDTMKTIQGQPQAVFMVEFSSDDALEVADRVEKLHKRLQGVAGITAIVPALEPGPRDALWDLRRAGMPILYGIKGDRKPITFIEDPAVAVEHLPEFVGRFREILNSHDTDGAFYGHASVGCLHLRPLINLKDPDDVARMRSIASEVTDLVQEYGGSLSGEHGDGLVRSEWNERLFGSTLYSAFCDIKDLFDPKSLLNPGKIVRAPRMTENLRYPPGYAPHEPETLFDYSNQEGFVRSVEMCNGSGVCRKMEGGTMCPSFRATRDEKDTTRGRANILRLAMVDDNPLEAMTSKQVHDVYDLCLMCKACKSECPSNVDIAKIKSEFLHLYHGRHIRPLGHYLMANLPRFNRLAAPLAPLVNWLQNRGLSRWFLEKFAGIDRRRSMPTLYAHHFRRWFAKHRPPTDERPKVLLLADCFTTYNEPNIGKSAVEVLERAGYRVELADMECCGRIAISKGFLTEARSLVQAQVRRLATAVADGTPILGLEPSCLLSLVDEWPSLVPSTEARQVAAASHLAEDWLAQQVALGECDLPMRPRAETCVVHGHCHQKALVGTAGTTASLSLIPELDVKVLDTGCCGMAGSFGFERSHYDISVKVAESSLLPALASAPEANVVAPGTSCRHQIHDLANRRAQHPMEMLAEGIRSESDEEAAKNQREEK